MRAMGFTVVRIWAFNDGPGWMSLQPQAGRYSPQVLTGLDWLLTEAGKRGMQLMLTFTNYWEHYGGMQQYVRWAQGLPDNAAVSADSFYTNAKAQELYRNFAETIITRVNSITGLLYKDDPVIHSWDLANEPRCERDSSGNTIAAWVNATAAFVKSVDARHPVTVGIEGFFGPSTPDLLAANPYNSQDGVDFVKINSSPHIDFASIHMYGDQWCSGLSDKHVCKWSVDWIAAHIRACQVYLGSKPLVLQEFGKRPAGSGRAELFREVGQALQASAIRQDVFIGALIWMFAHESYPDYDGYTVYASGQPDAAVYKECRQPVVTDMESVKVLRELCQQCKVAQS
eukprot:GHRR01012532.1.p1 GENE.GHRR01012532.1~~GHRR01012532.1.p1  ORF type:complete len:342 (+),score=76.98 GHRR01012532.1:359-1384(+)